ncbi:TetR family transcriptional regulator [Flavobacterium branchiophilum NBRC 15030 = ATCC 35035]|uniref:TetR family transcriptional regulator n=1 Tax=Flavobacterium branchiophilum TaxID=55197 RepID=A0A543FZL6_9FLAO|nr:TetR/AcrR family transcriptional regulator [Flavobacterium branchiophilum]OXA68283.1 TetR family transcriptional regulator [Flavobacterium branchiophilum NBRC 15030 = ATCC 35035]TQM39273.1 TetR family transcriptional regulator [Flavobacterium branchiophilum]GEM54093.1 TetR family transcriptional regulator [Flavobacterium branchiophilum NBRC 15030 = ATCC 35035]
MNLTARQIEIIEASGKILMQKGVKGLTTKSLALEMNFSESALYRHFKDKEAIISLLIRYLSHNIKERFSNIVQQHLDPEQKLLALFASQFTFFKDNPHFIVIVLSDGILDNSESIKQEIMSLMQTNASIFKQIIAAGQQDHIFRSDLDLPFFVHVTMGTFRLQMLQWKLSNFSFDIEQKGMQTMQNLLVLYKK